MSAGKDQEDKLDPARRTLFEAVADYLIPAAHDTPSAGDVVGEQSVAFALRARPDLAPLSREALADDLGTDPGDRLAILEADRPDLLAALHLVVVGSYYADDDVRAAIGHPGQIARPVRALDYPAYMADGLIGRVLEPGPLWRDPIAVSDLEGS